MSAKDGSYNFSAIEKKWQQFWEERKTFKAIDCDNTKKKYYVLDMFPYPSGAGLHVGHPEGYTASDIVGRYKRMKGFNVLHPMGWDAFGLPAEQYAIKTGTHPAETTTKNVDQMRRQIKSLGFSYDWDREVNTTDTNYYKWTQWIFLKLFNSYYDPELDKAMPIDLLEDALSENPKRESEWSISPYLTKWHRGSRAWGKQATYIDKIFEGNKSPQNLQPVNSVLWKALADRVVSDHRLAYEAEVAVNWCPALGTVLANEEVVGGLSERGGHPVVRKPMRQWMLRITKYAERLQKDLDEVDWTESIKKLQVDWIGRSVGAEVDFKVDGFDETIRVFTTRPDTLFGATYMVLAPEHKLVDEIASADRKNAIAEYRKVAASKSDLDRTDLAKEKTGEFTGVYAINPVNGAKIPIWISDYVLISYGTGAIMAVPAHDDRDFEFAKKFNLQIIQVVQPEDRGQKTEDRCFAEDGIAINSGQFTGLKTAEFKEQITAWLEEKGLGKKAVNYKLRDWLFSRQRYWGEPFPLVHCDKCGIVPLPESALPLVLPKVKDYTPPASGEPPLAKAKEWLKMTCPRCGGPATRETNTMPQWAGSCWYYLRYLDPKNNQRGWEPEKEKYWMNVDLYIGGAEHAVLHLLYSRFWHKLLFDFGYVSTREPFYKLVNQGMILGEDGQKMSKSRGNVVNPDKVVADYGADSMRLYEMFMGPLEAVKPWSMQGVEGVHRFLQKAWRMTIDEDSGELAKEVQDEAGDEETLRLLHQTIKKVGDDIEKFSFNTSISAMMIFVNHLGKQSVRPKSVIEKFVLILAPLAPHIAEELWERLGHSNSLAYEPWPIYDKALAAEKEIELAVQVNGKVKDRIVVSADADEDQIKNKAVGCAKVMAAMAGKPAKKIIVIKPRIVSIIT